jgi:hypothetical protein
MIVLQTGYVTPRSVVRRNQAAVLLAELARRGLAVTPSRLELHAIARYAGELPHRMIRDVVAVAMNMQAAVVAEPVPAPPAPVPTPCPEPEGWSLRSPLTAAELREIIRQELRRSPGALSPEIRRVVEANGPLCIQPQSFPALVSKIRNELGLPKISTGRPRRVA